MTARLLTHAAAAALLALAVGSLPAVAQTDTGTAPTGTAPTGTAPSGTTATPPSAQAQPVMPAPTPAARRMMSRVEKHIAELYSRLHITQAEEPQWRAFAQVMRENAEHMEHAFQAREHEGANMNALEDLRSYAAVAEAHAEDMQRLVPAFQALYEAMPAQQQRTADQVFRTFERRREMRHHAG